MSVRYWAHREYGVRLDQVAGAADLIAEMRNAVSQWKVGGYDFAEDLLASEEFADAFRDRVAAACRADGIELPHGFEITWSGDGDCRAGMCDTPVDTFVVGFVVPLDPRDWDGDMLPSSWPESFVARAESHEWIMRG